MSRRRTTRTPEYMPCPSGKRRFRDELSAKIALDRAQYNFAQGNTQRQERRYYPCKLCHGFHLTSQELNRGHA